MWSARSFYLFLSLCHVSNSTIWFLGALFFSFIKYKPLTQAPRRHNANPSTYIHNHIYRQAITLRCLPNDGHLQFSPNDQMRQISDVWLVGHACLPSHFVHWTISISTLSIHSQVSHAKGFPISIIYFTATAALHDYQMSMM